MKRFGLFALLVGTVVAGLGQRPQAQQLTIESLFSPNPITGRGPDTIKWSPDGKMASFIIHPEPVETGGKPGERGARPEDKAELNYIDANTGQVAVLVPAEKIAAMTPRAAGGKDDRERDNRARYRVAGYHWAPDSQHILFDANGQLWYYSLATKTSVQLTASADSAGDPKFSPDGKHLAYIRSHNLVVIPVEGGKEDTLTNDKGEDLLNGEVDWVYAEELAVRSNYFWSPDSSKIVFMQMNESKVPTYPITDFIPQHPTVSQEKYPKVGDPNPEVRLGVIGGTGGKVRWLHLTDEKDIYIPRFGWVRDGIAWATVLNRAQNHLDLYFVDVSSGKSRKVLSETSDTWIETDDMLTFLKSGDGFIWPSWRDGHTHLYFYSFDKANPLGSDASLKNQITKGEFEVSSVEGVDEASSTVYVGANAGDARELHLCSVKLDGSNFQNLTQGQAGTHTPIVSPDTKHFVDAFSSLTTLPQIAFCRTGSDKCDVFWKSKNLDAYHLTPPQFVDFKAEDGTVLHGLIYLPQDSAGKKVPLLNNPYGGPLGQSVRNAWGGANMLFNEILLRDGIAVLEVDNRGMGGRGKKFAAALMHNFGEVELKDQLAAIDQALEKFPQLDGTRMGWWGWSYGGFMTLNAMTHSDRFVAGVSVAPVTDWHDYDSIYTERYEGLIPENEEAYKKSSPVNFADKLHGHLLEVHGTSDDNVHMQNTMQMINSFINAGKQFDLQLYPRKTHGIAGQQARVHLYTRIRDHFRRELLRVPTLTMLNGGASGAVVAAGPESTGTPTLVNVQASGPPPSSIRIASGVAEHNLLTRVDPVYPKLALEAHIEGDVILAAIIDKQGKVEQVKPVSGHPMLIQAALDAVKQWTYKPYQLNGEPVNVYTTIKVTFHM